MVQLGVGEMLEGEVFVVLMKEGLMKEGQRLRLLRHPRLPRHPHLPRHPTSPANQRRTLPSYPCSSRSRSSPDVPRGGRCGEGGGAQSRGLRGRDSGTIVFVSGGVGVVWGAGVVGGVGGVRGVVVRGVVVRGVVGVLFEIAGERGSLEE